MLLGLSPSGTRNNPLLPLTNLNTYGTQILVRPVPSQMRESVLPQMR